MIMPWKFWVCNPWRRGVSFCVLNLLENVFKFLNFWKCSPETTVTTIWKREGLSAFRWREAWQRDWGRVPSLICRDYWISMRKRKETYAGKLSVISQWTMVSVVNLYHWEIKNFHYYYYYTSNCCNINIKKVAFRFRHMDYS